MLIHHFDEISWSYFPVRFENARLLRISDDRIVTYSVQVRKRQRTKWDLIEVKKVLKKWKGRRHYNKGGQTKLITLAEEDKN